MRDENLKTQADYPAGQVEAALRVLVEVMNLLNEYQDDILLVGGWVPDLLFPDQQHVGSIDVDVLINHLNLQEPSYDTIRRKLLKNGYRTREDKYFSYVKTIDVNGISYEVDVDILASKYGGTGHEKRSQHVQGLKALKATGGEFAFRVPANEISVSAKRPDGAFDVSKVKVVDVVPFIVMKAAALGRGKPKDAYDIYFCIKNYSGGVKALAEVFRPHLEYRLVREMLEKLQSKFASPNHAGPMDIVSFYDPLDEEEIERIKRDACEQMLALLEYLQKI